MDDDIHDHPKWIAILTAAREQHPTNRAVARGAAKDAALAWKGALIWGCRINCDGIVPETAASQIAPKVFLTEDEFIDAAPLLVKAGLWHSIPKRKGGPGWEIHDFADYQKAKAQVELEETREARKKALYRTVDGRKVLAAVKARDRDHCRYCWVHVEWKSRRGGRAATIDHVDPDGPNSVENCVVSCKSCNSRKGGLTLAEADVVLREPFFGDDVPEHPDLAASGREQCANGSHTIPAGGSGRARSGQVGSGRARTGSGPTPPHDDHHHPGDDPT